MMTNDELIDNIIDAQRLLAVNDQSPGVLKLKFNLELRHHALLKNPSFKELQNNPGIRKLRANPFNRILKIDYDPQLVPPAAILTLFESKDRQAIQGALDQLLNY